MTNDEHHDERYEDGDMSTGTVADYEDEWSPTPANYDRTKEVETHADRITSSDRRLRD